MNYDLRADGMSAEEIVYFIDLMDIWPGDILVIADGTLHYTGTNEWVAINPEGREVARGVRSSQPASRPCAAAE